MDGNILIKYWAHSLKKKGLFIIALVLTLHNKTKWQKGKIKHLLEVARSLLFINKVPKYLWGEAILTLLIL